MAKIRLDISDVAFVLSAVAIVAVFAYTAATELHWVAHAIAGILSLLFSVATAYVGAMLRGRVKPKNLLGSNLLRLHNKFSIYLTVLVLSAFSSGLWDRIAYREPLFWQHIDPLAMVVQGWFGLVVTILATAQVTPCLVGRRKKRKFHMILGYALVLALVIQIFLGVEAALVKMAGG